MMRLRIPELMYAGDVFKMKPKDDDDQMMGRKDPDDVKSLAKMKGMGRVGKPISAEIDWNAYLKFYEKNPREQLVNDIASYLLQTKTAVRADIISSYADQASRESFIKTSTIQLMSTPEYQLS
jgi:hypothetical protein